MLTLSSIFNYPKIKATLPFAPGLLIPPQWIADTLGGQKIKWFFRSRGYEFKVAVMPIDGSIPDRAGRLKTLIEDMKIKGPRHDIGHSLGGLDLRYLHQYAPGRETWARPRSVVLISTPNYGSPIADEGVSGNLPDNPTPWEQSIYSLTSTAMNRFNRVTLNNPLIDYASIGFELRSPTRFLNPLWQICKKAGYDSNDTMVPSASARWGDYWGTLEGEHIQQVNPKRYLGRYIWPDTFGLVCDKLDKIYY